MRLAKLSSALIFYRVMANVVGVMLIPVYVFIPISQKVESVIGPIHGGLYIVYLFSVLQLWIQARLGRWMVVLAVTAGWIPFTAFIAERWITRRLAPAPSPSTDL